MELSAIKGIGPTRLESLRAVGVCSLRDLLYFLPQRYEDRTHPIPCADANGGEVLVMGVVQDAPKLERPLMLIHGFADDNVTIAHSLRLSQALMAAGRPHTFLPLTGITHMTNDETVAENLLTLQRDFLRDALA